MVYCSDRSSWTVSPYWIYPKNYLDLFRTFKNCLPPTFRLKRTVMTVTWLVLSAINRKTTLWRSWSCARTVILWQIRFAYSVVILRTKITTKLWNTVVLMRPQAVTGYQDIQTWVQDTVRSRRDANYGLDDALIVSLVIGKLRHFLSVECQKQTWIDRRCLIVIGAARVGWKVSIVIVLEAVVLVVWLRWFQHNLTVNFFDVQVKFLVVDRSDWFQVNGLFDHLLA